MSAKEIDLGGWVRGLLDVRRTLPLVPPPALPDVWRNTEPSPWLGLTTLVVWPPVAGAPPPMYETWSPASIRPSTDAAGYGTVGTGGLYVQVGPPLSFRPRLAKASSSDFVPAAAHRILAPSAPPTSAVLGRPHFAAARWLLVLRPM